MIYRLNDQAAYYLSLFIRLTQSLLVCNLAYCECSDYAMTQLLSAMTTPLPPFMGDDDDNDNHHSYENHHVDLLSIYYNQSITDLNISHHQFGKSSFQALVTYIKRACILYSLELNVCRGITPKQMKQLMLAMKVYGQCIHKLSLQDFQTLSVKSMEYIASVPRMKLFSSVSSLLSSSSLHCLLELNLSCCKLKALHMKAFCSSSSLGFARYLKKLSFHQNPIGNDGMEYFCTMLLSLSPYYQKRMKEEEERDKNPAAIAQSKMTSLLLLSDSEGEEGEDDVNEATTKENEKRQKIQLEEKSNMKKQMIVGEKGAYLLLPHDPFGLTDEEKEQLCFPELQSLDFHACSLGGTACALLLQALTIRKALLSFLDLSYNRIGDQIENPEFYEFFGTVGIKQGLFNYCTLQSKGAVALCDLLATKPMKKEKVKSTLEEFMENQSKEEKFKKSHYNLDNYLKMEDEVLHEDDANNDLAQNLGSIMSNMTDPASLTSEDLAYYYSVTSSELDPTRKKSSKKVPTVATNNNSNRESVDFDSMSVVSTNSFFTHASSSLLTNRTPQPKHRIRKGMHYLGMAGNEINDSACKAIANMIATNNLLEYVDLGFNGLTNACGPRFKKAITLTSGASENRKLQELHVNLHGNPCDPYLFETPGMARSKMNYRFGIQPNIDDDLCHGYAHIANEARGKVLVQHELAGKYDSFAPQFPINGIR